MQGKIYVNDRQVKQKHIYWGLDRERPRTHLSYGFGIHRCVGNRLADLQLEILWEEIMKRFENIEVVGEPSRIRSSFVKGYADLPVIIH